jgi:hypothetical protein
MEIDYQADDCLIGEVASANAEPANFDQAGQGAGWPDHEFSLVYFEMDAIVTYQNSGRYLPRASGQDEIECQPRFAGA